LNCESKLPQAPSGRCGQAFTPINRNEGRHLRQHRQHRLHDRRLIFRRQQGCFDPTKTPLWRTLLTALTVCSALVLTLIILVPARPWRENVTSMPGVRRNVCARRSRPASARGVFGQPALLFQTSSSAKSATRKRSAALPVHVLRSAIRPRTHAATGSASIMPSMAVLRFAA
jgi:hypothetical protein